VIRAQPHGAIRRLYYKKLHRLAAMRFLSQKVTNSLFLSHAHTHTHAHGAVREKELAMCIFINLLMRAVTYRPRKRVEE